MHRPYAEPEGKAQCTSRGVRPRSPCSIASLPVRCNENPLLAPVDEG